MVFFSSLIYYYFIVLGLAPLSIGTVSLPVNRPKLCPSATWDSNAMPFANISTVGVHPHGIFIDTKDNLYVANKDSNLVHIWNTVSSNVSRTINGNLDTPFAVFVSNDEHIYIDNGKNGTVLKWTINDTNMTVMHVNGICYGLFLDTNQTLYCSIATRSQVVKKSMDGVQNDTTIVAGTGGSGSRPDQLFYPYGIFVDENFNLYVADCSNNRIQRFALNEFNATTVAGNGAPGTINLTSPTAVVLDADGFLFIVDNDNHRIVGNSLLGFRCIVGCSRVSGGGADQLHHPWALAFDTNGNIFVTDRFNDRVQKFILQNNTCDETTTHSMVITSYQEQTTAIIATTLVSPNCVVPSIKLIHGSTPSSGLLRFEQNEDFYISSNIQFNCSTLPNVSMQWRIYHCSSICSVFPLNSSIRTTFAELFIPAHTLTPGIYHFVLTVNAINASVNIQIAPSDTVIYLFPQRTSLITIGEKQNLILNTYEETSAFMPEDWFFDYYCRVYDRWHFPVINGSMITIEDKRVDPFNPSCLSNRSVWNYTGSNRAIKSVVDIQGGSLVSNKTYQWKVSLKHRQYPSRQGFGYLSVRVQTNDSPTIIIECVISTMCHSRGDFQMINPSTQLALYSVCLNNCSLIKQVTWKVYEGNQNSSLNITEWTLFNKTNIYQSAWFIGLYTSNVTISKEFFRQYAEIGYWRFEITNDMGGGSAIDFIMNNPPTNGACSIHPSNGTIHTIFHVICSNWSDSDGIKEYSLHRQTLQQWLVAFSPLAQFDVRLSGGDEDQTAVNLTIQIRDRCDAVTEYNLPPVHISTGSTPIEIWTNFKNQNSIVQSIVIWAEELNRMNMKMIANAAARQSISIPNIFISPLYNSSWSSNNSMNWSNYTEQLNRYTSMRESLITQIPTFAMMSSHSIALQASAFAVLSRATNQLTRKSLTILSNRCSDLANELYRLRFELSYEDVKVAMVAIAECTSNILIASHSSLQQRSITLNLDFIRANEFPIDYETDLEFDWANPNLYADGDDFSWITIQHGRQRYQQRQCADQLYRQTRQTIDLLTTIMNIHLNQNQTFLINQSNIFIVLEKLPLIFLNNKTIELADHVQIRLPNESNSSTSDTVVLLQSIVEPIPYSLSPSITNLSRSVSLSMMTDNGNQIPIPRGTEFFISLDRNLELPSMVLQNVTFITSHQLLFNLHYVNITPLNENMSVALHWQMESMNIHLAYLFIYRFDSSPILNSSMQQIDGWSLFCPQFNTSFYTYFIDNQRTIGHQSVIIGLRELKTNEMRQYCSLSMSSPPVFNESFRFTSNYAVRTFLSGCYYLDKHRKWQSKGLRVGAMTNHIETHCIST